jgi:nucleoside 2-deoxyribosyltransferase
VKVFIICPVRNATFEDKAVQREHVAVLEKQGHSVHWPPRDTDQNETGLHICQTNRDAIAEADEVHLFYTPGSQGTHFDMGMAFALNKSIRVISSSLHSLEKSFINMAIEWELDGPAKKTLDKIA